MYKTAIKHYDVESSNIQSIGHSYPRKILEIKFRSGGTYRYKGVPRSEFKKLLSSQSKGSFFHHDIKYNYPYKKYKDSDGEKLDKEYSVLKRKKPSEALDELVIEKAKKNA